jgi:NADH-quinone oxidoreductase subunit H
MNPWLRAFIYALVIVVTFLTVVCWALWFERKLAGRMQSRVGPTINGYFGLVQPMADVVKLLQKELLVPANADRYLFLLAPPLTVTLAFGAAVVVPFSPEIMAADLDVGVLYILAVGALTVIPTWTAGWASNNKYAMLGGMRAVAQGISYEIPLVLSALVPVILAGSMSLSDIVKYQTEHGWFAFMPFGPGLIAFVLFLSCSLAEANRIPFDIPEAESELVAGISTEYTGMAFGLLYLTEYLHTLIMSAVAATLFFGGWDGPWLPGLHWMVLKTFALFATMYAIRWSLIRFRSDQLMNICWKYLVPFSLVLVMVSALWVQLNQGGR